MKSNPLEKAHVGDRPHTTPINLGLLQVAGLMLAIGSIWRLADIFIFDLGGSVFNVMPSKLGPLVIILAYFWLYQRSNIGSVLGLSKEDWKLQIPVGVITGLTIVMGIDMLSVVLYAILLNPAYPLDIHIANPLLLIYMFVFFLINAVFEEVLFRGLLQNSFMFHFSPHRAILLSSLIFGVWHACWPLANGFQGLTLFVEIAKMVVFSGIIGLFFGYYYHRFSKGRTLMGTIAAHTMLNFVNEGFKLGPEPATQGPDFSFVDSNLMVVTLLMFIVIFSVLLLVFRDINIDSLRRFTGESD